MEPENNLINFNVDLFSDPLDILEDKTQRITSKMNLSDLECLKKHLHFLEINYII